jgi:hypothetical protein
MRCSLLRRVVKGDIVCVVPSFHNTMDQMGLPVCPRFIYMCVTCVMCVFIWGAGGGWGGASYSEQWAACGGGGGGWSVASCFTPCPCFIFVFRPMGLFGRDIMIRRWLTYLHTRHTHTHTQRSANIWRWAAAFCHPYASSTAYMSSTRTIPGRWARTSSCRWCSPDFSSAPPTRHLSCVKSKLCLGVECRLVIGSHFARAMPGWSRNCSY